MIQKYQAANLSCQDPTQVPERKRPEIRMGRARPAAGRHEPGFPIEDRSVVLVAAPAILLFNDTYMLNELTQLNAKNKES